MCIIEAWTSIRSHQLPFPSLTSTDILVKLDAVLLLLQTFAKSRVGETTADSRIGKKIRATCKAIS